MVEQALALATKAVDANRVDADRVREQLQEVERESARLSQLLCDPDVLAEPMAKKALLRKAAEVEAKRDELNSSLGKLAEKANGNTEALAANIRSKLLAAKKRWETVAEPSQLNRLIEDLVGPSVVTSDGRLVATSAKESPVHGDVHGVIEGSQPSSESSGM
jgi:hypothetical protein